MVINEEFSNSGVMSDAGMGGVFCQGLSTHTYSSYSEFFGVRLLVGIPLRRLVLEGGKPPRGLTAR